MRTLSGSPCSRRQWNSSGRPFGSRVSAAETVIVRVAALRAPDAGDRAGRVEELLGEALAEVVDALGAELLRVHGDADLRAGSRRA